ncbi:ATP-binding protein [Streptacidiphilus neutrinimicus]|uniref:ATP-binding protein n=1 Tax=Streptacidiphilus neutrinimicus TaxID=105420 RepID=UPI000A0220BB|nr:ATP-binding protein [Streptacidiphilus neutrinimicus]
MHVRGDQPCEPPLATGTVPVGADVTAPPGVEGVWRFAAPAVDITVSHARHAVRDLLLAQGIAGPAYQDLLDGLLLIVSELVTNSVRHAALLSPELVVEVVLANGWVRVSVEDSHPYRPKALSEDFNRLGGRGLLLVKAVTAESGGSCDVERTSRGGKIIWVELPIPRPRLGA